jgi:phage replication-related protein YjqB (UPF0714/DUF867 family)
MKDKYVDFRSLVSAESECKDFRIRQRFDAGKTTIIIAPHGGRIEEGTSSIVLAIAGADFNYYMFEGLKRRSNFHLHLTSHRFDEPTGLRLVSKCEIVVAIHGCRGEDRVVFVGGLNAELKDEIAVSLRAYRISVRTKHHPFMGKKRRNICNRGINGKGVQLEITRGFRERGDLAALVCAVREVLLR